MKRSSLSLMLSCALLSGACHAAPVQLSSFNNFPEDRQVNGFHGTFLYSDVGAVNGFDLPILGYSELDHLNGLQIGAAAGSHIRNGMNGAAISLANWHSGEDNGLNIGLANQVGSLNGVSIGIYSGADETTGMSLGLVNTEGLLSGSGNMTGLNIAGIANYGTGGMTGVNVSPFNWTEKEATGLNLSVLNHNSHVYGMNIGALANWNEGAVNGLNIATVNWTRENMTGANISVLNHNHSVTGMNISALAN